MVNQQFTFLSRYLQERLKDELTPEERERLKEIFKKVNENNKDVGDFTGVDPKSETLTQFLMEYGISPYHEKVKDMEKYWADVRARREVALMR